MASRFIVPERSWLLPMAALCGMFGASSATAQETGPDIRSLLERQRMLERRLADQERRLAEQQRLLERLGAVAPARSGGGAPRQPVPPASAAAPPAPAPPAVAAASGGAAPVGPAGAQAQQRREESRVLETDPGLARTGGVLSPRGMLTLEPSVEYAYTSQNRAFVSGFTVIPGITFGSVDIRDVERRTVTASATLRLGVTDRLEVNTRIPYVRRFDSTTTQPVDVDATPLTIGPTGSGIGDVEFGASYQFNDGREGWPVFIGNLRVKSTTGRSPFEVPVYTTNDGPEGRFLRGLERELPTGSGFWAVEPGVTMVLPTDPAVIFANARYIWNVRDTVSLPNSSGGARTRARLDPGDGIGLNFGIGIALNEVLSLSMGYEHIVVLPSSVNGQRISGSATDVGTFNFGISYRLSDRSSLNIGFGIGATGSAPDMRLIVRIPYRLQAF